MNMDGNFENKRKIKEILFAIMSVLIFILTSITVVKTSMLRRKAEKYESFFIKIDQKESTEMNVKNNGAINSNCAPRKGLII